MSARFGYTLMTEQSGPRELVNYAVAAEEAGFDFEVSSDHFSPWLTSQGHAPNAWVLLGAVAQATSSVELMTYVTCPTMRYHPAIVAQQSATLQILSEGRFILGLGSGENLNEHVVGEGWPSVDVRQGMLQDAVHIIRELHTGELTTWEGDYFRVDSARIWDTPDKPIPLALAVSGDRSIQRFADLADHLIAVEPDAELVSAWDEQHGSSSRKIGQIPISWDPDEKTAIERAHDQFRWFGGGWAVNADLPTPAGFEGASQFVRPEDVAEAIPCGPDLDKIVEGVKEYLDAGFTDVALVQVGDAAQSTFLAEAAPALLEETPGALTSDAAPWPRDGISASTGTIATPAPAACSFHDVGPDEAGEVVSTEHARNFLSMGGCGRARRKLWSAPESYTVDLAVVAHPSPQHLLLASRRRSLAYWLRTRTMHPTLVSLVVGWCSLPIDHLARDHGSSVWRFTPRGVPSHPVGWFNRYGCSPRAAT